MHNKSCRNLKKESKSGNFNPWSYRRQPYVGPLDVEKRSPCDVGHRGPDLLSGMNNVNPKCVNRVSADVITVYPRDEYLALVIVDEQASNHFQPILTALHDFKTK